MSCPIKIKTLNYLKDNNAIGSKRVVTNAGTFDVLNEKLTRIAYYKHGVGDMNTRLFTTKVTDSVMADGQRRVIVRAIPNEKLFKLLQEQIDSYESLEERKSIRPDDVYSENALEKLNVFEGDEYEPISFAEEILDDFISSKRDSLENFILFNNEEKLIYTAEEVLNNIITNGNNLTSQATELVNKILPLLGKSQAKVIISPESERNADAYMTYNATKNVIYVYPETLKTFGVNKAMKGMLHEVIHSVTYRAYKNPTTFEQTQFKALIDEAFNYFIARADGTDYGFKDQGEFIAEIYSNPNFQQKLRNIENNWWNKFVAAVRRILGLKKSPSIDEILNAILDVSNQDQEWNSDTNVLVNDTIEDHHYTKKDTPKDRVDSVLENILYSIEENIRKTREFADVVTSRKDKILLRKQVNALKDLRDEIRGLNVINKSKAILTYVEFMNNTLSSLNTLLDEIDYSNVFQVKKAISLHSNYITGYSIIDDISKDLASLEVEKQDVLTKEELSVLKSDIAIAVGNYASIDSKMLSMKKLAMKDRLNNIKYFPNIESKHRKRLAKEHSESKIQENKESWIVKQLNGRDKDLIDSDVAQAVNSLIENPSMDIYANDVIFSSPTNVSAPLIQIMNQFLLEIESERLENERIFDADARDLFNELRKEKGTNTPKKLYENIIGFDKNGKPFIETDVKAEINNFRIESDEIRKKFKEELGPLKEKLVKLQLKGDTHPDYIQAKRNIERKKSEMFKALKALEKQYFEFDKRGVIKGVLPKYRVTKKLTPIEEEVKQFFLDTMEESEQKTFGKQSLVVPIKRIGKSKVFLYELPKITKSDMERIIGGEKGIIADKWKDLTQIRPDDIDYNTIEKDEAGNVVRRVRIHYRDRDGSFDNKDQSLDLFQVIRLEYKNANIFSVRQRAEMDFNYLLDIAKHKEYYPKKGTTKVLNWRRDKLDKIKGSQSSTYKMMNNLMESRFYDIMRKSNTKVGKIDVNKAVSFINGASAFLSLSLNIASGTANVVNANAQMFLESFIKGDKITAKGIKKANSIYAKHFANTLNDITDPINTSFVNQVNEIFNVRGHFNLSQSNFLKSDLIKKGLSRESLQVFQESGEHWVQSVVTMSVLEGIKVLNSNGDFINKEGKVVKTEKEAASLLDMMKKDEGGLVQVNPEVGYTTHSRTSLWNEGGREKVAQLIVKKLYDTIGNYRRIDQPDIMRSAGGQLMMLYRKYFIPMGQARFRGIEYSLKPEDELEEDERRYSYALQEYEEGTYVSLIRYISQSIKDKKYYILSRSNWENLSDYQRHNIKRAVGEFVLTFVMLPLAIRFVMAGADDNEYLYFLAYQLRRLDTELSQYFDPSEAFKMIRSPIPSARLLETAGTIFTGVFTPWTWDEQYMQGPNKGESKLKVRIEKQIPVLKEFRRSYEDLFNYQNSNVGTGL